MGRGPEQTLFPREHTNGRQISENAQLWVCFWSSLLNVQFNCAPQLQVSACLFFTVSAACSLVHWISLRGLFFSDRTQISISMVSGIETLFVSFGGVMLTWFFLVLGFSCRYLHVWGSRVLSRLSSLPWQRWSFASQLRLGFWTCALVTIS